MNNQQGNAIKELAKNTISTLPELRHIALTPG